MGFVRFAVRWTDKNSGRAQGLFQAAALIRDGGDMNAVQEDLHEDLKRWFDKHLEKPERFGKNWNRHEPGLGLSWFRDSASDHIGKMREFAELLRSLDVVVDELYSERPGKLLYEDEFQVVALPFSDSGF